MIYKLFSQRLLIGNNMKLKPLNENIIVKPIIEDEVTKSGIVLPDTVDKEKPEKGEVIAVGEGKTLDNGQKAPMSVKVGDIVIFKKYSPDEIKIEDVEYLVISESDILAILESDTKPDLGLGNDKKVNYS